MFVVFLFYNLGFNKNLLLPTISRSNSLLNRHRVIFNYLCDIAYLEYLSLTI